MDRSCSGGSWEAQGTDSYPERSRSGRSLGEVEEVGRGGGLVVLIPLPVPRDLFCSCYDGALSRLPALTLTQLPLANVRPGGPSKDEFRVFHDFLEEREYGQREACSIETIRESRCRAAPCS